MENSHSYGTSSVVLGIRLKITVSLIRLITDSTIRKIIHLDKFKAQGKYMTAI